MFGFNKKKKDAKPARKQSSLDKILMGVIVGGAIGSVLGVGLATKKGSDTRKEVGKKAGKVFSGVRGLFGNVTGKVIKTSLSPRHHVEQKNIPEEK